MYTILFYKLQKKPELQDSTPVIHESNKKRSKPKAALNIEIKLLNLNLLLCRLW